MTPHLHTKYVKQHLLGFLDTVCVLETRLELNLCSSRPLPFLAYYCSFAKPREAAPEGGHVLWTREVQAPPTFEGRGTFEGNASSCLHTNIILTV